MSDDIDTPPNVHYTGQAFTLEQTHRFADWLAKLRDVQGRARILKRLVRFANGQAGDVEAVGDGVCELRMFFGSGYRIYYMQRSDVVILLLAGGDKDGQAGDIARAKELARHVRDEDQGQRL